MSVHAKMTAIADEIRELSGTTDKLGLDEMALNLDEANQTLDDIYLNLQLLSEQINTYLDSDDVTLDQMSEVVASLKANKDLISSITTDKVNVSDIINNLTTNVTNKPLSAAQGVALKALIDAIEVPVQSVNGKTGIVSLSASDVGAQPAGSYLTKETDPTVPAWAKEENPPSYTKSDVGLGNVDNTSDANKPVSIAQAAAIADAKKAGTDAQSNLTTHTNNKTNPHGVTKDQVGLENVDNVKQYSASNPPPYPVTSVNGKTGAITLSAGDVGADSAGTATSAVSSHNSSTSAHTDIRNQVSQLSAELDAIGTRAEIVQAVIEALPVYNGEVV